jgi:hypothetical protein
MRPSNIKRMISGMFKLIPPRERRGSCASNTMLDVVIRIPNKPISGRLTMAYPNATTANPMIAHNGENHKQTIPTSRLALTAAIAGNKTARTGKACLIKGFRIIQNRLQQNKSSCKINESIAERPSAAR